MKSTILQGSVFDVLPTLPAGSVDVVCTSPPYWQLRSYLPKDHALKPLELGSEKTPAEFVENMVRVFQEVKRVLAEHGTVFINIGDTYSNAGGGGMTDANGLGKRTDMKSRQSSQPTKEMVLPAGNLCLIPQRLAIALQDARWTIRSVIVWHKPAPMPSSVSGWAWRRCRVKVKGHDYRNRPDPNCKPQGAVNGKDFINSAEWRDCPGCEKCRDNSGYVLRRGSWRPTSAWEPILMLAKSDRYFCDGEAVKQPMAESSADRFKYGFYDMRSGVNGDTEARANKSIAIRGDEAVIRNDLKPNPSGANLRDVWTIAAEPLKEAHYAAFPSELVYRCLKAGTSAKGYCPECGSPWVRVMSEANGGTIGKSWHPHDHDSERGKADTPNNPGTNYDSYERPTTLGWRPSCSHTSKPRSGVALDPFSGSGRTGIAAKRLGLDYIGVELNPTYVEMSERLLAQEHVGFCFSGRLPGI